MSRSLLLLAAVALLGGANTVCAADSPHAHGNAGGERMPELAAQAAFDADGILWAVHKVSGHIAVSRSEDRGRSWSNPVLATATPEPTDTGTDARPKIAFGGPGEIYLTWTKPLAKPYTGEIRFSRSLDAGRTFSPSAVVHRDRQEITHRFDAMAVNAQGQIFVAWIDKRDLPKAAPSSPADLNRGAAVYFAVSDDRGATFRGDFKAADNCCECCRIALVAQDNGTVKAMWRHIFAPNVRDHAVATLSGDGQASSVQRASFENWGIDACPHHGPALTADASGGLHAVWFSGATAHRGVFYGRIRPDGVDALRRVGSERAGHADIAAAGSAIAVAWKSVEGGRTWLRGMTSSDGGNTWREHDLGSVAGGSDYPRVLFREQRFHVFWNTAERPLSVTAIP